ncbi:hypothetical protein [Nocardiopsis oceani]
MPYHAEPLRPSERWPHVEWWVPLMAACATLQRADPAVLLSPLDVSGPPALLHAAWDGGPATRVSPGADTDAEDLRRLLGSAAPGREVRAALPGHEGEFWAPHAHAPVRVRYAWLLDQLSIDSTHWHMKRLNLLSVEADQASESAEVTVEVLDAPGTVVARVPLLRGEELVGAPDWIAGRVRAALAEGSSRPLHEQPGTPPRLIELPR